MLLSVLLSVFPSAMGTHYVLSIFPLATPSVRTLTKATSTLTRGQKPWLSCTAGCVASWACIWCFENSTVYVQTKSLRQVTVPIVSPHTLIITFCSHGALTSLVPRPPRPAFVTCSTKNGGRPGRIYHVMRASADFTYARLSRASPRIHVAAIARALSMLASTAKKATWCMWSFCLVKSS